MSRIDGLAMVERHFAEKHHAFMKPFENLPEPDPAQIKKYIRIIRQKLESLSNQERID